MASPNFKENKDLYNTVFSELKALGVKVPKVKKFKCLISKQETPIRDKKCKVFGVYLCDQEWISEGEYPLPKFVSMATTYLQNFVQKEIGLFRKAGNFARQKKLRIRVERGEAIQEADPHDVASLLKQWMRELPEPLIPVYLQDLFVRCQCLENDENRLSACLLTFLLLPPDHLHTLKHMLKFFSSIAKNIDKNRMGTYNLALIIAPNVFISNEPIEKTKNNLIYKHTAIVKTLIEHCDKVGEIPPSLSFKQNTFLGSDLYTSSDLLDINSNKSKKKIRNGSVQDIFNGLMKLVGQNPSLSAKAEGEDFVKGASVSRHTLDDLDVNSASTPIDKDAYYKQVKNAHARRKSFGALLLRRKDKKRRDKHLQSEPIVLSSKTMAEERKSTFIFNINDISPTFTETKFQFNDLNFTNSTGKEDKSNSDFKADVKETDFFTEIAPVSQNKAKVHYSKSCMWNMNRPEIIEASSLNLNLPNLNSNENTEQTDIFSYKPTLSRKEAFSYKNKQESGISDIKNWEKKGARPKISGSVNNLSRTCSHSQTSLCNLKCDKNKSAVTERRTTGNKTRQQSIQEKQSDPRTNNQCPEYISEDKLNESLKKVSKSTKKSRSPRGASSSPRQSLCARKTAPNDYSRAPINPSPSVPCLTATVDSFKPQSLDLELNLLLQNFCVSPPSDSSEIRLSIDITAAKSSPDLQVNVSQKGAHGEEQKNSNIVKVQENRDKPKTRKRLSSKSDSRIPRWKKLPLQSRPYSFSGSSSDGMKISKDRKTIENISKSKTKIPVMVLNSEKSGSESVKDTDDSLTEDSLSNSCFKTPKADLLDPDSITWHDGSQYLSAISTPEDEIFNKRESIARILQENPGHVLAKVNLYDNKVISSDSSNSSSVIKKEPSEKGRLLRVCSEKYPPGSRAKKSDSNSCETASRSRSVKYKTTYPRFNTQPPLKFTLSDIEAPSPISIRGKTAKTPSPLMTIYKGIETPSSRNTSIRGRDASRFSLCNTRTKSSGVSLQSNVDTPATPMPLSPLKESTNSEDDVFLDIE